MIRKLILFYLGCFFFVFFTNCNEYQKILNSDDNNRKYKAAEEYYNNGEYRRANRLLEQLVPAYRGKPQAERLVFFFADSYFQTGNFYLASYQFESFIKSFPKSQKLEEASFFAAKSHYISRGTHSVPMLLRLIIGRGWGQGPAHSQSLESLFSAIPGLKVIMPSFPDDAKGLIISALEDRNPFICIENRWSHYTKGNVKKGYYKSDITKPKKISKGKDITIVSTGFMTLEVKRAVDLLKEINVAVDHFDLRVLRPLFLDEIVQSVKQTGFIMCVDTGHRTLGIGSEIISFVTEKAFKYMKTPPVRLGLPDHPTPSSRGLVIDFYPDTLKILKEVFGSLKLEKSFLKSFELKIKEERNNLPIDVPDNFFKGPF